LRAWGALAEGDLSLPPSAGVAAVVRRLRGALARIGPGFEVPPPWRLVGTTAELQRIGRAFRNCVALPNWNAAQHDFHLLDGSGVYLVSDTPPLLASLRRASGGLWVFDQMTGPRNAAPPAGAQDALLRGLVATGLRVVATDPHSALSRLEAEARRRRRAGQEEDLDDELDDAAEDDLAA
jgi:hypothetical protein